MQTKKSHFSDQELADSRWFAEYLFRTGQDSATETSAALNYNSRGIAAAQKYLAQLCEPEVKVSEGLGRAVKSFGRYVALIDAETMQLKRFRDQAARHAWPFAQAWLAEDRAEALRWMKTEGDWCDMYAFAVYRYMGTTLINQLRNVPRARMVAKTLKQMEEQTWWEPYLHTVGGTEHFLCFMLTILVAHALHDVFSAAIGRTDKPSGLLASPGFLRRLPSVEPFWVEEFSTPVALFGMLPNEMMAGYVAIMNRLRYLQASVVEDAVIFLNNCIDATNLAEKETAFHKKHITKLEGSLRDTRAQLAAAQSKVAQLQTDFAQRLTDPIAGAELETAHQQTRALQKQLAAAEVKAEENAAELFRLKEFVDLLLHPPAQLEQGEAAGMPAAGDSLAQRDPRDVRVVVVGGHERLHAKLRKILPQAVFLHPDRSQFAPEVFASADCALFCAGYCSHKLAWRAAQEVRKHGVRAGYTDHVNVDQVLDDLRSILAGEHDAGMTREPATISERGSVCT